MIILLREKLERFQKYKIFTILLYLVIFLILFLLELNTVGLSLRQKIPTTSTLDFSWFSDLIERYLHGYILGRDFTFTYGPLFQYIYSLPSIIFHVPSYTSVALAPILSFIIIFILTCYIAQSISKNIYERMTYLLFVFVILGLLISSGSDTVKALVPLVYSLLLWNTLHKKFNWGAIVGVSLLPTVFGLYTYNLFFTTSLQAVLLLAFFLIKNRKRKVFYLFLLILPFIAVFQLFISIVLTHNFDYVRYSIDSISNYRYVLDVPWAHDRVNILLLFPLLLITLTIFLWKTKSVENHTKNILYVLIFASLIELDYAISRSDAGHLLWAFFPSVFTFYTITFILGTRVKFLFPIAIFLYLFVPFKPSFYNTIAPKNIVTVIKVLHQKTDFFSQYQLPNDYYYSEAEIKKVAQFIHMHKNTVYIYPYDSYILNSENTTYNSFALGIYTYSDSITEKNTVTSFEKNPPRYIILGVDTKGALNLDDIPNFTRNPQLALWMIKNYSVKKNSKKYLILTYTPKKKMNSTCQIIRLTVTPTKKETLLQKIEDSIKPAIYYSGTTRLPYAPSVPSYLLFQNIYNASGLQDLFQNNTHAYTKLPQIYVNELTLTRKSPFLGRKDTKTFQKGEFSATCEQF